MNTLRKYLKIMKEVEVKAVEVEDLKHKQGNFQGFSFWGERPTVRTHYKI
jgi:hypothetical protein